MAADVLAIAAQGAHALPVVTALTVQDHNQVHEVVPVDAALLLRQGRALIAACTIGAVKIGIPGNRANADAIAQMVAALRAQNPDLPVVLDPVLASGHGDVLGAGNALDALAPLLLLATLVLPNLAEAAALAGRMTGDVLVTGGHGEGADIVNRWRGAQGQERSWRWPRLAGEFHGSGCTLAAAVAARLALGDTMPDALGRAQAYTHQALARSFALGAGQRIPQRCINLS